MKVSELVLKLQSVDQDKEIEFIIPDDCGTINFDGFSEPWECMGSIRVQMYQSSNAALNQGEGK